MKFTTKNVIKLKETKIKLKLKVNMKKRENNMRAYKWSKRENKL